MTFEELKTEILSRGKRLDVCGAYYAALNAESKAALLSAGGEMYLWLYQSGIIDDSLLNEFTEEELNAAKIYRNSTTIDNPANDIYLVGGNFTVNISNSKCKICIAGIANLNLNVSNTGFAELEAFDNSVVNIVLTESGCSCLQGKQNAAISVVANDNSVFRTIIEDRCALDVTANDNSYMSIKSFHHSSALYLKNNAAEIEFKAIDSSTIAENIAL